VKFDKTVARNYFWGDSDVTYLDGKITIFVLFFD